MAVVWKVKSDGKSDLTSGFLPFQTISVPQSFSHVCFSACLHAGTALLFTAINPTE